MSGETSKVWLKYVPPSGYTIQERRDALCLYEIQIPELGDWCVGMVEQYAEGKTVRWRTLDHRKEDWRSGFLTREEAAQDLVANCPRAREMIETGAYIHGKRSKQISSNVDG